MLILSEKLITTKCQPPDLRAWVADRAAVAPLGPDNPAAASGTSHHPPPSPRRIGCSFGSSRGTLAGDVGVRPSSKFTWNSV